MFLFCTKVMFLRAILIIFIFFLSFVGFRHTSFLILPFILSPSKAEDPSENKEENPSCHSHYQSQLTGHGRLWPPLISFPAHSNSIDIIYVFPFSLIASFSFSFIQMNCRTRSSIRDGRRSRRRIGEKIRVHFIRIGITRTYEKHPENFMILGLPVSPLILSHQNHPICTFRNHRMCTGI